MKCYIKNNKGLTVIVLVLAIVAALAVGGVVGVAIMKFTGENSIFKKSEQQTTSEVSSDSSIEEISDKKDVNNENDAIIDDVGELNSTSSTNSSSEKTKTYKGYDVVGQIEIPKTKVKYPILAKVTKGSLETAVAVISGPGPNKEGNTVIVGHNYRNNTFFSNNKKLANGDKIYITDNDGKKVSYTIYNKFETTLEDTSFYLKDTKGAKEVTLSTCTDDTKLRIVLEAKADEG